MAAQSTLRQSGDPIAAFYHHYATLLRQRLKGTSKTTRLLGTLFLALSIIAGGEGGRRWWVKRTAEKEEGRRLHRRNSGLKNKDGSRVIFVPYGDSTSKVTIHPTKPMTFDAHRRLFLNPPRASGLTTAKRILKFLSTDEARSQYCISTPVSQSAQYHDSKMDQQGDWLVAKPWNVSDAPDISFVSGGQTRRRDCARSRCGAWKAVYLGHCQGKPFMLWLTCTFHTAPV